MKDSKHKEPIDELEDIEKEAIKEILEDYVNNQKIKKYEENQSRIINDFPQEINIKIRLYEAIFVVGSLFVDKIELQERLDNENNPSKNLDKKSIIIANSVGERILDTIEKKCKEENIDFPVEEYRKKWEDRK